MEMHGTGRRETWQMIAMLLRTKGKGSKRGCFRSIEYDDIHKGPLYSTATGSLFFSFTHQMQQGNLSITFAAEEERRHGQATSSYSSA